MLSCRFYIAFRNARIPFFNIAFEASFIHPEDKSTFTSAYTDALYKVVDEYAYCKYVRRLKELEFEGQSYAFFVNYFKGSPEEYVSMNYYCAPYET